MEKTEDQNCRVKLSGLIKRRQPLNAGYGQSDKRPRER